jgi:hypothetical protein
MGPLTGLPCGFLVVIEDKDLEAGIIDRHGRTNRGLEHFTRFRYGGDKDCH